MLMARVLENMSYEVKALHLFCPFCILIWNMPGIGYVLNNYQMIN